MDPPSSQEGQLRKPPGRRCSISHRTSLLERILVFCVIFLVLVVIILLIQKGLSNRSNAAEYCLTPTCVTLASVILNAMDQTVDPCTDFYQYSCGGWIKENARHGSWSTINQMIKDNNIVMKYVLEDVSFELKSEAERKARTYYMSCLDKNGTAEKLGPQPMHGLLRKIGGWHISGEFNINQWNFQLTLELIHNQYGCGGLFFWSIDADDRNSSRNVIVIGQGQPDAEEGTTFGLSSRDYYLNKSKDDELLVAYLNYMTEVGVLLGGDETATRYQMEDVLEFETKLANVTMSLEEQLVIADMYHKMSLSKLRSIAPFLDWTSFFNSALGRINRRVTSSHEVVVYFPEYLRKVSRLVAQYLSTTYGKIVISNYLGWTLVRKFAFQLSKPFRKALDKLMKKSSYGFMDVGRTWKDCVADTDEAIGFALGAMYVREVFKGSSKNEAENMMSRISDAFKENFPSLKWMDPETRKLAEEKTDAIMKMVGFPEHILDPKQLDKQYEGVEFSEDEYFKNVVEVRQFARLSVIRRFDQPPNRTEWDMTPSSANAYYADTRNQIVFPAGNLRAPFYDRNNPKYFNYGAIGAIMGHELTHAFDDIGREYDKYGNLHQWWKNSTIESFRESTQCLVDQYSSYEVNGEYLNGKLALGENIADNGGLKAAFNAYKKWAKSHPTDLPLPALSLSNYQLFFVGFAQSWCSVNTPKEIHLQIFSDTHSPAKFSVIGAVSNSLDFARVFKCPPKSAMNPENKCELW